MIATKPNAVLFDLLTALIDSWTLWDRVAGSVHDGRRWRAAYLKLTYAQGEYVPYEVLVREAAESVGLSPELADRLVERYPELTPWPDVEEVLGGLQGRIPLGVVTNCSETLGTLAVARTGHCVHYDGHRRTRRILQTASPTLPACSRRA